MPDGRPFIADDPRLEGGVGRRGSVESDPRPGRRCSGSSRSAPVLVTRQEGSVRQSHAGSAVIGLLLVLVGGYYLLRNVLHVDVPTWNEAWPVILIVLGA